MSADERPSIVLSRNGQEIARDYGRGIGPILKFYDEGLLVGADVEDKIIGRAASAICILGGVRSVRAGVAAEGAVELLKEAGIDFAADLIVPTIVNREGTGPCPMEEAVQSLVDPSAMLEAVRQKLEFLKGRK